MESEFVQVGPLDFEYDRDNKQMMVGKGEQCIGLCEFVQPEEWSAFIAVINDRTDGI